MQPAPDTRTTTPRPRADDPGGALDNALRDTFPASDPVSMLDPGPPGPDRPVVENEVEARQGVTGHNVRYVLGYGIVGVVIAFAVLFLVYRS